MADELKNKGNAAFAAGDFETAISAFSEAIQLDSQNAVLYSNRSAAYASLKRWEEALEDAQRTTQLKPDWGKGWSRLGAALQGCGDLNGALEAYKSGLAVDASNVQLQRGLEAVQSALEATKRPAREFPNPFADSDLISRLAADSRTSAYLKDPEFMAKLAELQQNPQNLNKHLQDPRMMTVLSVLLNLEAPSSEAKTEVKPESKPEMKQEVKQASRSEVKPESKQETKSANFPTPKATPTPEEAEAIKLKDQGNEAYKRKDFATALDLYTQALALTPNNPSLLLNQSAAHYEAGDYDAAVKKAEAAVDLAREVGADFTFYGKAYARMANAHFKADRLEDAVKFYNKSLTEHRTAETLAKLRETEKMIADRAKAALYNPELAEAARNEGNEHFKAGRFVEAVTSYTEAIRRDEKDPRAYSNRAACYLKLAAIPEGLKDCETALKLDPKFIRAYIRKAALLFAKRDYAGCLEACDAANTLDTDSKHASEISAQRSKATFEIYKEQQQQQQSGTGSEDEIAQKIARDPELGAILSDPVMRSILGQMQQDPAALLEHMKNPVVAGKIRKLIAAGILKTA